MVNKIKTIIRMINEPWSAFWINVVAKSPIIPDFFRCKILRMMGMKINTKRIRHGLTLRGKNLVIEDDAFINHNCFIDASVLVTLGKKVSLAFGVMICTSTHEIGDENNRAGKTIRLPVKIEEGCWIGANATILPGVTIGKGCIVGAGSLVSKDCEPNGLYVGVPARRIKDLPVESKMRDII